ncbi:MAG: hypothetical protein RL653_3132, partial [Pseudomonadota bacterium]
MKLRTFDAWVRDLDVAALLANSTLRIWLVSGYPTWLLFVAVGAWIPGTSAIIGLKPGPVLAVMAVHAAATVLYWKTLGVDGFGRFTMPVMLLGSVLLHLGLAVMVAFSALPGAVIYGIFLVLTAYAHGMANQAQPDVPWTFLPVFLSCTVAPALNPTSEVLTVFSLMLPGALFVAFSGGSSGRGSALERSRRTRLEQALAAQELEKAQAASRTLERRVIDLLGANHDIKNLLSTAVMNAASLRRTLEQQHLLMDRPQLLEKLQRVEEALALVASIARTSREAAISERPPDAPASVSTALAAVNARLRQKWPLLQVTAPRGDANILLPGGAASLERILENLLGNAAEGNGARRASCVEVQLHRQGPWARLVVEDDGPGFTDAQLRPDAPVRLESTKPDGMGLGLITVASLVAAARGELARSNHPGGGARVEV